MTGSRSRQRVQRTRRVEGKSSAPQTMQREVATLSPTVELRQVVGNTAIQRLMTESTASGRIPTKSVNKAGKFFKTKGSQQAQQINQLRTALMNALRGMHGTLGGIVSHSVRALQPQMTNVLSGYDLVVQTADALIQALGDNSDERMVAALEIKVQATNEKSAALEKFLARIKNPPDNVQQKQTVAEFIGGGQQKIYMNPNLVSGHVGGAMNKLTKYGSEEHGNEFFKPNQDSIDHYSSMKEGNDTNNDVFEPIVNQLMENSNKMMDTGDKVRNLTDEEVGNTNFGQFGDKEGFAKGFDSHLLKQTNMEFTERAGIDLGDLRSSNREVAMSRLNTILDTNLISKANLALKKTGGGGGTQLGSVAPQAKGKGITDYNLVDPGQQHPGDKNSVSKSDPVLMSKLNALQMIDFLAGQADRHQGNYMVQTDRTGQVTGVTGIDNDMSFGTKDANTLAQSGARVLPILGIYFDKEMAQKIMQLDEALLRAALSDLLNPQEIQATVDRLNVLKNHLQNLPQPGGLLDPDEWEDVFESEIQIQKQVGSRGNNLKSGEYGGMVYGANR